MSRICRNLGDSGKVPRLYELDHESKMRLLKTHSHTSDRVAIWSQEHAKKSSRNKRRSYNKAIVTHQKPAACRRCGGGGRKGSRTCRMPPVWRGGQERLYGKPTTENVLWRAESSSIWRGTQALTQGRSHAKNLPRAIGKAGG